MKKDWYLFVLIFLSLLPFVHMFTTWKMPHTHDGLVHIPRIAAYYKSLMDGGFPVRWASDLNYGYGMPLYIFIYPFPYLFASMFVGLGFGLVNAFKITLFLSFLFSGIFMYLFAYEVFKDKRKAFFITIFYQFAPFRFVELLVRGSFGEVYTYTFLPLVLFCIVKLVHKKSSNWIFFSSLATALLVLSHNAISLVFFAIIVLFTLLFGKNKKEYSLAFLSLFGGLLFSAFYWIPAIAEHKYTYGDLFMQNLYKNHFPPLVNFFIPNLFNSKNLQTEGIAVGLGLFHTIALVAGIFLFVTRKLEKPTRTVIMLGLMVTIVAFFFMTKLSFPLWQRVSILRQFQFPWRFLSATIFSTSILAISYFFSSYLKKQVVYWVVTSLVVLSVAFYWQPSLGDDEINEQYYWNFPLNTTYYGETDVVWSAGPAKQFPKNRVEFTTGEGSITNVNKRTYAHSFNVSATTNAVLVDHTEFFPGWRAYVDGQQVPIEFQNPQYRGELTFPIQKGDHLVTTEFSETAIRKICDIVSLGSFVVLAMLSLLLKKKKLA